MRTLITDSPHPQLPAPARGLTATDPGRTAAAPDLAPTKLAIEGAWELHFPPNLGAPETVTLDKLISWADHPTPGVKYFSGTATYTKSIEVPASWLKPDTHVWLDLGSVKNLAEVSVNGKSLGIVWKQPYRVDATSALKPGANSLEVKVTNGWANRIIGDRQPNVTKTYTFTSPKFYKASSPLWASGLLGPVQLVQTSTASTK